MGAGSSTDHYMQDAAEAYIVFKLQELAVGNDVALTDDVAEKFDTFMTYCSCLLYTSPSPRDRQKSRMPSSA